MPPADRLEHLEADLLWVGKYLCEMGSVRTARAARRACISHDNGFVETILPAGSDAVKMVSWKLLIEPVGILGE
jgi:hypothetical protein